MFINATNDPKSTELIEVRLKCIRNKDGTISVKIIPVKDKVK